MSDPNDPYDLQRFVEAQNPCFESVCSELRDGRKTSHWMWFIFPQIRGLGNSPLARRFRVGRTLLLVRSPREGRCRIRFDLARILRPQHLRVVGLSQHERRIGVLRVRSDRRNCESGTVPPGRYLPRKFRSLPRAPGSQLVRMFLRFTRAAWCRPVIHARECVIRCGRSERAGTSSRKD